ncbi:G protein-coupled receptor, class C, group 5, member Bb [Brachyhypopomus gauderio]|uniref:G protein-coupled receptor, class C, group 5, member Bb n=1 Tax=Brachyhypopomus gauderio TaxID=698409 RepID=UPI004041313C
MMVRPGLHFLLLLLLLSLTGSTSSEGTTHAKVPPPPRGCGSAVSHPYQVLCDLDSVWGVVLEAVACGGAFSSLVLTVILLARLKTVTEAERRSGVGPLLLLLLGVASLFGLSLAFVVGRGEALCVARRALWGALFALCFSCLLVQAVRLRRLVAGGRSPAGSSLSGLALALTLVQGVIAGEWLLLTVGREGHAACDYPPLDFALAGGYALSLLLVATAISLGVVLCVGRGRGDASGSSSSKRRKWRCNAVWLLLSCLTSLLIWAGWLGFYLYGDADMATAATDWDEPALAVALVMEGWVLLLFHAIPEAHLCLRQANQRSEEAVQDYYDARQPAASQARRFGEDDDEAPSNSRAAYGERQAFSIEEHSTAVQAGGYHAGVIRPTLPFRSHVYQPTEMALLMNGGTIPTAPPNYTRRNLW